MTDLARVGGVDLRSRVRESQRSMKRVGIWLGITLASGGFALGCNSGSAKPKEANTASTESRTAESERVTEIEDQLRSALYQLQPENLGIDSNPEDATSVLNNWWAAAQVAKLVPTTATPAAIPAERLNESLTERLGRNTFDVDDGRHIRAAYLARKLSDLLSADSASETETVRRVFDWTCRNVALRGLDETPYPVGFYEALIIGRGTAADRALVCASILRQLRIDTAVFTPAAAKDDTGPWWFGVLAGDQWLLFDMTLGLPVPRGDQADPFAKAATLSELQAHPEWLTWLSPRADQAGPWRAEDLTNPRCAAIALPISWSARMWALEQLLPNDSLIVLYEAPASVDAYVGVFERIAASLPGRTAVEIGLWDYPQRLEEAYRTINALGQRALQAALTPFIVPVEIETKPDADGKPKVTRTVQTMAQLKFRTDQLSGKRSGAIAQYMTIRQLSVSPPPDPSLGPVYQRAAEDALYWSCVCKYESGEWETATAQLGEYLKRYRRGGQWTYAARALQAETLRQLGRNDDAVKLLKVQESDDPYRARHAVLMKVWTTDPVTAPAPAATEPPAAPAEPSPIATEPDQAAPSPPTTPPAEASP